LQRLIHGLRGKKVAIGFGRIDMLELNDIRYEVSDPENNNDLYPIIKGINFRFDTGKFYAITGPNGSGKTTLAKLIMGIIPVSGGNIILDGVSIEGMSVTERAQAGIAYAFQHPARFKGVTFRDIMKIASGNKDESELVKTISSCGICSCDFLDKPVDSKLSGGEIKKIELASVMARIPKLAIYDEPDTGIDLWTIAPMVEKLKREQEQHGTTTLVISHNKAFLEAADVLLLIRDGKIVYSGDFDGARLLLEDLSACNYKNECEGENDAECYR